MKLIMRKFLTAGILFGTLPASVAEVNSIEAPLLLSTTITVNDSHLIVPVSNYPKDDTVVLGLYDGSKLIQNFIVSLPKSEDAYWLASYPLDFFGLGGKEITIKPIDGQVVSPVYRKAFGLIRMGDDQPETRDDDYAQPYRNQFHASSRHGWNNDPNGLVYHDGKYHLYYQYNPFGIFWGNMHWGHFESTDLIHWKEKSISLYQKTVKDMAFSGGGFVDFNNSAGLGKGTQFVAFTSTGRGECLAYSLDGGQTFTELPENPVVKHNGRDPKVLWYAAEEKWVMALYDSDACPETEALAPSAKSNSKYVNANIAFYESKDLRKWERSGAFTDADRDAIYECPELFQLDIEGKPGESRWILYGAQNRYFIGDFNGKTFVKESGPHGSTHGAFYAAQTFSDIPDGRRIQIGWVRTDSFEKRFPNQVVNQSFTLPHEMTLRETGGELRIHFGPVKESERLRGKQLANGKKLTWTKAYTLLQNCENELTEVLIEFENVGEHTVLINGIDASFEGRSARIFTDRTFSEIYANDGLFYEVRKRSPEGFKLNRTQIGIGPNERLKSLKVYRLKSIWK